MKISELSDLKQCTGCSACSNICPQNAISMCLRKSDGFFYPKLDESKCVNCGLCGKVCSINKEKTVNENSFAYSAAAIDDEIRQSGSSGGIFRLLAEHIMNIGGVVFGAVYDAQSKTVKHKSTEDVPLKAILRSKYVQSTIGDTYWQVKTLLKQDRVVLFSGTPCQVRGLKAYLDCSKVKGNLLTVDFFCHGVPSPGIFKDSLDWLEKKQGSQICNVTFREKDLGWHTQVTKVYFANNNVWKKESLRWYYYVYFVHSYSLRDSCYNCTEYSAHMADITMADYWMISPEKDDNKGTSLLIVNTENGHALLNEIMPRASVEELASPFKDYEIYSHANYQSDRKALWQRTYEKYGLRGLRTRLFLRVSGIAYVRQDIKRVVRRIKKIFIHR